MKLIKRIIFLSVILTFILTITSCEQKNDSLSYVTMEINPGVEIVVDGNNNVVSINGINDDGKTLIFNIDITGLSLEEVIELVMKEAEESGYLISAEYNIDDVTKEISISITSDTDASMEKLNNIIKDEVETYIEENDLAASYKELEAKGREYFNEIILAYNPTLTEKEVNNMSYNELMAMVELATLEKASFASMALEEYYLELKEYEFQMKYRKEIAGKLSEINMIVGKLYNTAITTLESAIDAINELQYSIYVSEDSAYLKLLNKLNEYKDTNVKLTVKLGSTENATEIKGQINANVELIESIENQIKSLMEELNQQLEASKEAINSVILALDELEKQIQGINYEELLIKVEQDINNTKSGLIQEFESQYAADINQINTLISERKEKLEEK